MKGWTVASIALLLSVVGCSGGGSDGAAGELAASPAAVVKEDTPDEVTDAEIRAIYDQQFCIPFTRLEKTVRFLSQPTFDGRSFYKVQPLADGSVDSLTQGAAQFRVWGDPIAEPVAAMLEDLEEVSRIAEREVASTHLTEFDGKKAPAWPDLEASLEAILDVRDPCETQPAEGSA